MKGFEKWVGRGGWVGGGGGWEKWVGGGGREMCSG